jgi:hypothetical protein
MSFDPEDSVSVSTNPREDEAMAAIAPGQRLWFTTLWQIESDG